MNAFGETALHLATVFGHTRLVSQLLKIGANVNIETVSPSGTANPKVNYSG